MTGFEPRTSEYWKPPLYQLSHNHCPISTNVIMEEKRYTLSIRKFMLIPRTLLLLSAFLVTIQLKTFSVAVVSIMNML